MELAIKTPLPVMALACLVGLAPFGAAADESQVRLRDGAGKALVEAHCVMCHSLDYIQMNSVFLDRAGWQKSVDKMVAVMGAPLPPGDVAPIVDYLTTTYGR
jgi:cytochrome c5